jgi:hypothetical protein
MRIFCVGNLFQWAPTLNVVLRMDYSTSRLFFAYLRYPGIPDASKSSLIIDVYIMGFK